MVVNIYERGRSWLALLIVIDHLVVPHARLPAAFGPVSREQTRLEESLRRILAEGMCLIKARSSDGLDEVLKPRLQLLLREARVENESLVLVHITLVGD